VGARFAVGEPAAALTVIANPCRDRVILPSVTLILMLGYTPMLPADGVPLSVPVVGSNAAHDGLFAILNESTSPFGSEAVGRKK